MKCKFHIVPMLSSLYCGILPWVPSFWCNTSYIDLDTLSWIQVGTAISMDMFNYRITIACVWGGFEGSDSTNVISCSWTEPLSCISYDHEIIAPWDFQWDSLVNHPTSWYFFYRTLRHCIWHWSWYRESTSTGSWTKWI